MAKFDLSSVAGVIHNGQEVNGVYLNGVLVADFSTVSKQTTYVLTDVLDLVADDEVIFAFYDSSTATYWAIDNNIMSNGRNTIEQVNIDENVDGTAMIQTDAENIVWTFEWGTFPYFRLKSNARGTYLYRDSSNSNIVLYGKTSNDIDWIMYNGYMHNKNEFYPYVNTYLNTIANMNGIGTAVMNSGKVYFFKRIYDIT